MNIIGVNCIRTSELRNYNVLKTIGTFEIDSDFNFFCYKKLDFQVSFISSILKNLSGLENHEIFNKHSEALYQQRIVPYIYQLLLYVYQNYIWKNRNFIQYTDFAIVSYNYNFEIYILNVCRWRICTWRITIAFDVNNLTSTRRAWLSVLRCRIGPATGTALFLLGKSGGVG